MVEGRNSESNKKPVVEQETMNTSRPSIQSFRQNYSTLSESVCTVSGESTRALPDDQQPCLSDTMSLCRSQFVDLEDGCIQFSYFNDFMCFVCIISWHANIYVGVS